MACLKHEHGEKNIRLIANKISATNGALIEADLGLADLKIPYTYFSKDSFMLPRGAVKELSFGNLGRQVTYLALRADYHHCLDNLHNPMAEDARKLIYYAYSGIEVWQPVQDMMVLTSNLSTGIAPIKLYNPTDKDVKVQYVAATNKIEDAHPLSNLTAGYLLVGLGYNDLREVNPGKLTLTEDFVSVIELTGSDIESFTLHSPVHLKLKVKGLGSLFLHFLTEEDANLASMQVSATTSGGKFYYSTAGESYSYSKDETSLSISRNGELNLTLPLDTIQNEEVLAGYTNAIRVSDDLGRVFYVFSTEPLVV